MKTTAHEIVAANYDKMPYARKQMIEDLLALEVSLVAEGNVAGVQQIQEQLFVVACLARLIHKAVK